LAELKRELDTLRLAAGARGGGLAEREVTETDGVERFEAVHDFRYVAKKHAGVAHGHVEHVGDGVAVKEDFERLAVEALALAAGTRRVGVGHELHVELDDAVALAAFATAAAHVEGEAAALVATDLGERDLRVEVAEVVEELGVGGGIGARTATDGRLVHLHEFFEEFEVLDVAVGGGEGLCAVER